MFKYSTVIAALFLFVLNLQAETSIAVCGDDPEPGDRIVVFCDGSVFVDVENLTGLTIETPGVPGSPIVTIPSLAFGPLPSGPFLSTQVNNGNFVQVSDDAILTLFVDGCDPEPFLISEILDEDCEGIPPTFHVETPCGDNLIKVECTGQVYIDLADDVWIYKVWNGGTLIAEWNNFDPSKPDVIVTPFLATDFGALVPSGANFYLDIQSPTCGQQTVNISRILTENCGFDYNTGGFTSGGSDGEGLMSTQPTEEGTIAQREGRVISPANGSAAFTGLVYPNPVSRGQQLNFELQENAVHTVSLVDLNGKVLLTTQLGAGQHSLQLPNVPAGSYRLVTQSPQAVNSSMIIVN